MVLHSCNLLGMRGGRSRLSGKDGVWIHDLLFSSHEVVYTELHTAQTFLGHGRFSYSLVLLSQNNPANNPTLAYGGALSPHDLFPFIPGKLGYTNPRHLSVSTAMALTTVRILQLCLHIIYRTSVMFHKCDRWPRWFHSTDWSKSFILLGSQPLHC